MTRIIQIRRGTSVQNNKFTGRTGELSFDTEAKTLRVHDGETLGGFELARMDKINNGEPGTGSDFDINSVPDEFWKNIVEMHTAGQLQTVVSKLSSIGNVAYLEYMFGINATPKFTRTALVCQTPEAGYSIGDIITAFGIGTRSNPSPNTFTNENGMYIRMLVGGEKFWVSHNTTGITTQITNANWKIQYTVWY